MTNELDSIKLVLNAISKAYYVYSSKDITHQEKSVFTCNLIIQSIRYITL